MFAIKCVQRVEVHEKELSVEGSHFGLKHDLMEHIWKNWGVSVLSYIALYWFEEVQNRKIV